jgi:protein-S-isoprenylcysteine O-methyltransferase Ste14
VRRSQAAAGTAVFFLAGPGLEAGVGPYLLTRVAGGQQDWPPVVRIAGAAMIAAGLAVLIGVFARFVREGAGTPSPAAPATRLIVGGAYRYVRHPMYVATAAVIVGEGLAFGEPVLFAGACAYVVTLGLFGRLVEEPRLARRFGARYDAYRRAVPGWRPRLRPWDPR